MFNSYLGNTDEEFYANQQELRKLMAQDELLEEQRKKRAMKKTTEAAPPTEEPSVHVKYTGGEKIVVQGVMFSPDALVSKSLADSLVKMPYFELVVEQVEKKSFIEKLLT